MSDFLTFAIIGFLAQLIDGALGMGFGVISSSVLLGMGFAPALASASVNAAKIPTSGTAAISHYLHRNLDRQTVIMLCIFGGLGGVIGMLVLTSLKGAVLSMLVTLYLIFIGTITVWRGIAGSAPSLLPAARRWIIGLVGGLIEGIGGSWGPIVTTSLAGTGLDSRYAIGSSNFAEFFVSAIVFVAYVLAFSVGHWEGGADWMTVLWPVLGLVCGGLPAALFGGWLAKIAPRRPLTILVGLLAITIAVYRLVTG